MEGAPLSGFLPVSYGFSVLSPAHSPRRQLLTAKGLAELQAGWVARCLQKRWDILTSGGGTCALRGTCSFPRHVPCPGWTPVLPPPPLCAPVYGPSPVARGPPAGALKVVTGSGSGAYGMLLTSGSSGGVAGPGLWK